MNETRGEYEVSFHGINEDFAGSSQNRHCNFEGILIDMLMSRKLRLIAHTHPSFGKIIPSGEDRKFLKKTGQEKSIIVSSVTGKELTFSSNVFEDV